MYPDPSGPKVGDPIPRFASPDTSGVLFLPRTPQMAGNIGIILVLGDPAGVDSRAFIDAAIGHLPELAVRGVVVAAITTAADPAENLALAGSEPPFPILADVEKTAIADFGRPHPAVFLVDRNSFVVAVFEAGAPGEIIAGAAAAAAAPDLHPDGGIVRHAAPVIQIHNLLEPEFCRQLIALWATDNRATGVAQPAGAQLVPDTYKTLKSRRDHRIDDAATLARFRRHFGLRLLPEIHKVFFYQVTKQEFLRIGCYDAGDGGVFRPHRDTNPPHQRRLFALTINLNTGEYDGGALRFPEYSPDLYAPPPGGAVVFPCSLIHEVTPITRGRRYAVVTFLF